jgi:hypothetical protein
VVVDVFEVLSIKPESRVKYGSIEYRYAEPIARGLLADPDFRRWVLSKSKFVEVAGARLLKDDVVQHRKNPVAEWWRFHFSMICDCLGCSGGRETDIFTVFEGPTGLRFAMHFEVKQPADGFQPKRLQEQRYPIRANCWIQNAPPTVLPHKDASTGIFFSERKRAKYAPLLNSFDAKITFEEIEREFPRVAEWTQQGAATQ